MSGPGPDDPTRHRLPSDTDDGLLLILSGPSGVGKTSITRGLERRLPDAIFSVSATTRPRAPGDVDGVDYHFVGEDDFDGMIETGDLLEWAEVYGKRYGTPRRWVEEHLARGRVVVLDVDVQGAKSVKRLMPAAFGLFVLPPDEGALLARLRARERDSEAQIERRFAAAQAEIAAARESGLYDRFVVNDDLERATAEAIEAVRHRRATGPRTPGGRTEP